MNDFLSFPTEYTPAVIAVVRRGLGSEADLKVRLRLEQECLDLEARWVAHQRNLEDDGSDE